MKSPELVALSHGVFHAIFQAIFPCLFHDFFTGFFTTLFKKEAFLPRRFQSSEAAEGRFGLQILPVP